jgi:predicted dehydrogenase
MNIAIIGAGLIGKKRALSLPRGVKLLSICDVDSVKADAFAKEFGCRSTSDWKEVVNDEQIDALFVCTPNKFSKEVALGAIKAGKHILVEKPGALHVDDLKQVIDAHKKKKVTVMFGYNHRYHPAILKAKKIIDSKKHGEVLFMRAKYGHGGRVGYDKEWRFKKELSGGGHLSDQGTHLIDLVNYFGGNLPLAHASLDTFFWDTKLEDTAVVILKNKKVTATLSTSCVEWKNVFCFEIMLKSAKIQIDGLGRSYGAEKLTLYTMNKEMGPPKVKELVFEGEDTSWHTENKVFFERIKQGDVSASSLQDAHYVLSIINQAYLQQ